MAEELQSRVFFLTIYVKEAHAADQWKIGNVTSINQHKTTEERMKAAKLMINCMQWKIPTIVDTIDNEFEELFSVWPERFVLLQNDGKVLHVSTCEPHQNDPAQYSNNPHSFREAILKYL